MSILYNLHIYSAYVCHQIYLYTGRRVFAVCSFVELNIPTTTNKKKKKHGDLAPSPTTAIVDGPQRWTFVTQGGAIILA